MNDEGTAASRNARVTGNDQCTILTPPRPRYPDSVRGCIAVARSRGSARLSRWAPDNLTRCRLDGGKNLARNKTPQNATEKEVPTLSVKQTQALAALVAGQSMSQAAGAASVDRTTVYRWLSTDPLFAAEYNASRRELAETVQSGIRRLADEAIATLRDLMGRTPRRMSASRSSRWSWPGLQRGSRSNLLAHRFLIKSKPISATATLQEKLDTWIS